MRASRHVIEKSEYLPTLNRMLECCCQQNLTDQGLPTPREAFIEACQKPSPKAEQQWSHPIVYHAGLDSDWFFLANNTERLTWPVFKRHYESYLMRINRGEKFKQPNQQTPPTEAEHQLMTLKERRGELEKLRQELGL